MTENPRTDSDVHPHNATPDLVYFSSVSENTHRFVQRLDMPALRIPLHPKRERIPLVNSPYVLVVPSYGGGSPAGAVPKQVIAFLNEPVNRAYIRGVITSGNTNFGEHFCIAGPVIAAKCGVPELYRFELLGTPRDVSRVRSGLAEFWRTHNRTSHAHPNTGRSITEPTVSSNPLT